MLGVSLLMFEKSNLKIRGVRWQDLDFRASNLEHVPSAYFDKVYPEQRRRALASASLNASQYMSLRASLNLVEGFFVNHNPEHKIFNDSAINLISPKKLSNLCGFQAFPVFLTPIYNS